VENVAEEEYVTHL